MANADGQQRLRAVMQDLPPQLRQQLQIALYEMMNSNIGALAGAGDMLIIGRAQGRHMLLRELVDSVTPAAVRT